MRLDETTGLAFGPFVLDMREHTLQRDGDFIALTPKAFQTLRTLAEHAATVVTKDELIQAVWPDLVVEENNLNQQIRALRKALGEEGETLIETLPRIGYRLNAEVFPVAASRRQISKPQLKWFAWAIAILLLVSIPTASLLVQSTTTPNIGSIAVLPFTNQSSDPDDAYLGFAVAEALIRRLGATPQIATRPASAISQFVDQLSEPAAAGRSLRVQSILTGTVLRTQTKLRVTSRLIRVDDGAVLWSGEFERLPLQLFDLPNDIYESVARELKIEPAANTAAEQRRPAVPEAYEEYVKGRFLWNRRNTENFEKAVIHFKRAIELDPNYAAAWAGLADAYGFLGNPEGAAAQRHALALDDSLAEARAGRALGYLVSDFNFALARKEFEKAIQLDPGYATAHHWYAFYFAAIGEHDRALEEIRKAKRIDPSSLIINTDYGQILYYARRFDEAARHMEEVVALDPNFAQARIVLALAYMRTARHDEAIREMRAGEKLHGYRNDRTGYATALATAGRHAEARRIIEEVLANPAPPGEEQGLAEAYAALGEKELALDWLERAYRARRAGVALMNVEPKLDSLRGEPRFDELVQRLGLDRR